MILVDSSTWIVVGMSLWSLAKHTHGEVVAVCPPIIHELLQGIDDERRYALTRELLHTARILDGDVPLRRFEEAAQIYMKCRSEGYTIRSSYDCLIAACAIAHEVPLLTEDRDFGYIAKVTTLRVLTRS